MIYRNQNIHKHNKDILRILMSRFTYFHWFSYSVMYISQSNFLIFIFSKVLNLQTLPISIHLRKSLPTYFLWLIISIKIIFILKRKIRIMTQISKQGKRTVTMVDTLYIVTFKIFDFVTRFSNTKFIKK